MIKRLFSQNGYLLMEVLIVVLIMAVAFVAFMGVMGEVLRVSSKANQVTEAVSRYEAILFEIETGLRPDLASYGGRGDLGEGFNYRIEPETDLKFGSFLKSRLSWNGGKEFLDLDLIALGAAIE